MASGEQGEGVYGSLPARMFLYIAGSSARTLIFKRCEFD